MVGQSVRQFVCMWVGLSCGIVLGTLFVPDPTSLTAGVLSFLAGGVITAVLYRSEWLRDGDLGSVGSRTD
ncbi:hypothetical protein BRC61_01170 [Halobacteriales archaeon QH_10_65_19]|nr:MAG: hypothetical protein BRC61_01170 [Halobacteriales archaeon QH_10_65_19]